MYAVSGIDWFVREPVFINDIFILSKHGDHYEIP